MAVTLSLAYATIRMIEDKNLVRVLKACETVDNATTICSDKTGTLTENKMTVVTGLLGTDLKFGGRYEKEEPRERDSDSDSETDVEMDNPEDIRRVLSGLPNRLTLLLRESIALNSTAFEAIDAGTGKRSLIGSQTETALLGLAKDYLGMGEVQTERENAKPRMVHVFPFSSSRRCMGTVFLNGRYRLLVKGASEVVLEHSNHVIDPALLSTKPLSKDGRKHISNTIESYASHSLRTISLAYRDFEQRPDSDFDTVFQDMVFIGVVGIKDPIRPGVIQAVADCRNAGISPYGNGR